MMPPTTFKRPTVPDTMAGHRKDVPMPPNTRALIDKIQALPAERIAEIEDFVDFIAARAQDRALVQAATAASVPSFTTIWDNPDDDVYDAL